MPSRRAVIRFFFPAPPVIRIGLLLTAGLFIGRGRESKTAPPLPATITKISAAWEADLWAGIKSQQRRSPPGKNSS
jgi:hypothetical protein